MIRTVHLKALVLIVALLGACGAVNRDEASAATSEQAVSENASIAIFAGGCFWCTESDFEKLDGVYKAESGYTGGHLQNPRYEDTHDGSSGHTEAVRIFFDPDTVSYAELLAHFFVNHDPLDGGGQFCDRGSQYRPAVFYLDEDQKTLAEHARARWAAQLGEAVKTEISEAKTFWVAEDYHQDYYKKNPIRYRFYRSNCGRDGRLEALRDKLSAR